MTRTTCHRLARAGGVVALALFAAACSGGDGGGTKTITATDYRFENLPNSVKAGTKLALVNASTKEAHEMVVVRLADSEKRAADELVRLPQEQLQALSTGPPAAVLVAPPGRAPQIAAVGDGTLKEKGRYLVLCSVPTGADPAEYLKAGGDPSVHVAGGPPHLANGMYGQITVK